MSIQLAKPTFESQPDEELVAVDVYEQTSSETINSYQETGYDDQDSGVLDALSKMNPKDLLDKASKALGKASQVAAAVARAANSNNPAAAISAAAGVAGSMGMGQAAQALRQATSLAGQVNSIGNARNISQILSTAGRVSGFDLSAVNKLAATANNLDKSLSSFRYNNGKNNLMNLSQSLRLGAGMTSAVGSILGDMSPAMTKSFNSAAQAALQIAPAIRSGDQIVGRAINAANADVITRAIAEFKGETYNTNIVDSAGLAGTITGMTYSSHLSGVGGTFQALTHDITDMRVVRAAAVPLAREAAMTGDVQLFMDLSASKVGKQLSSSVPEIVSGMIINAKPPLKLAQQEYSRLYDNFDQALNKVTPDWKSYKHGKNTLVNAAYVSQNLFFQDLLMSKMNAVMGPTNSNNQSVYPQNSIYNMISASGETLDPNNAVNNQIQNVADLIAPTAIVSNESFGDASEAYMLLASVFPAESVDNGVQKNFPFFYATLKEPLMGIPV